MKAKLIKAFKIGVIVMLALAISVVAIIHWKSDAIIAKVLAKVENQLTDSLTYRGVQVNAFRYFPCIAIEIADLHIGSGPAPLVKEGNMDIVVRLWPLLRSELIIHSIYIHEATLHLAQRDQKWSYDILKKSGTTDAGSWKMLIEHLGIKESKVIYEDGKKLAFNLKVSEADMEGKIGTEDMEANIRMDGVISAFTSSGYETDVPIQLTCKGHYLYDIKNGTQEYTAWEISHDGVDLAFDGNIHRLPDHELVNIHGTWQNGKPEILRQWLPSKMKTSLMPYTFSGDSEGEFEITGRSSPHDNPPVRLKGKLKNAGFKSDPASEEINNLDVEFEYDTKSEHHQGHSVLSCQVKKESLLGSSLTGDLLIDNLAHPSYTLHAKGRVPAVLINLVSDPEVTFTSGEFSIDELTLEDFRPGSFHLHDLLRQLKLEMEGTGVRGQYLNNKLEFSGAKLKRIEAGEIQFDVDELIWDKAEGKNIKATYAFEGEPGRFTLSGEFCEGQLEGSGNIDFNTHENKITADWKVSSIEMKKLLESFSNFDQAFITSEHLSGKATIWAETILPMDAHWKIKPKEMVVKGAIDIRDGRLQNLKTLEDFSKYIHLEDLKDIRFSQLRNYIKIEDAKVYLPVMFMQSSAVNLSISGVHGFDHRILYNVKLNAGQTVANKLRKSDVKKEYKPARKSGWINMYYILEGTVDAVRYQQYRTAVLSGFEQSAQLKESLRNYLVDKYGYDVYWIEPNEWEDIPEYK